jgi:hypothetical protein
VKKENDIFVFLELLKAGLWADLKVKGTSSAFHETIDWGEVYQLAEEQSVIGVVLAGIEYSNIKPSQELLLQWIGEVQMQEQQNREMDFFIEKLIQNLRDADIYTLLVKGQGIAQCYERPLWRISGDVDLFLSDSNYNKAKEYLLPLASSTEPEAEPSKHLGMTIDSWVVELHGTMRSRVLLRMDKVIDEVQKDVFYGGNVRSWMNGETTVFLPNADNDVIFIFTHILKHFFRGGIGLRQICDWCRLLWTYRDKIDINLLEKRITRAGIMSEWKAFAALAVNTLGMPVEAMPLYDSNKKWEKKANKILAIVLKTGNFGHNERVHDDQHSYIAKKILSFKQHTRGGIRRFGVFPMDSVRVWLRMLVGGISAVIKRV